MFIVCQLLSRKSLVHCDVIVDSLRYPSVFDSTSETPPSPTSPAVIARGIEQEQSSSGKSVTYTWENCLIQRMGDNYLYTMCI